MNILINLNNFTLHYLQLFMVIIITFRYFWLFHPRLLLVISSYFNLFHLRLFSAIVSFFFYFMFFFAIVNYFSLDYL